MTVYRMAPWGSFGLVAALLVACGGDGTKASTTTSGQSSSGSAAAPVGNTNPDGIPYPSPPYGRTPRSGSTPGSVIQDFKFSGYPNAVVSPQLQAISLADSYDPCGKRSKLIHLTVGAVWCTPCNQETDAFVAAKVQLDAEGVVVLQALEDGPMLGIGATQTDLNGWIATHHPTFTEMLDPDPNPMLGAFFNAAAVPWNADIDPRTMELLDSSTGWSGDVTSELAPALKAVQSVPVLPVGVTCN